MMAFQVHATHNPSLGRNWALRRVIGDLGWIRTYGSKGTKPIEISVLSEGGSGPPTPELSIEVDDFDEALRRMTAAKMPIEYGPANEPWGVRRFYVRDPFGKLINVLAHS